VAVGVEPLVVAVQSAGELRNGTLGMLLEAGGHSSQAVSRGVTAER
jgi:hypothetical protein